MLLIETLISAAREHRQRYRRPLVTLSYAQSLDGSIALQRDRPLRLSAPEALELTHRLRAAHDAILVGIGTVLADDPQLTVRLVEGRNPQPVVLDSHLRLPLEARVLHGPCPPWIATLPQVKGKKQANLEALGARLLPLPPGADGRPSLPALLDCLADLGVDSLMVEGGARVISAFLGQGLVDWVVLTIAPLFVGGVHALESALPSFLRLREIKWEQWGNDLVVWGQVNP